MNEQISLQYICRSQLNRKILDGESSFGKLRLDDLINNWIHDNSGILLPYNIPSKYKRIVSLRGHESALWEKNSRLDKKFRENNSTEILAFYIPFHMYNVNSDFSEWGIYIYQGALEIITNELLALDSNKLGLTEKDLRKISLQKILHHEKYHHAIEVALTPLYENQKSGNSLNSSTYLDYGNLKSRKPEIALIEEKFCNSHVAMQAFPTPYLKRNKSNIESSFEVNEYVQQFMRTQPPGYRDFQDYLTSAETTSYLFDQMGLPQNPKLIRASASAINKAFKNRQIPMHIILD